MEYINDRDFAVDQLNELKSDIDSEHREDNDNFIYTTLGFVIVSVVASTDNIIGNTFGSLVDQAYYLAGNFGAFAVAATPLSSYLAYVTHNAVKNYWFDRQGDFIYDEKWRIKYEMADAQQFPFYGQEDVESHVRDLSAKKYGGGRFATLKALFKDRHDVIGVKNHVFTFGCVGFYAAAMVWIGLISDFNPDNKVSQENFVIEHLQP